MKNIRISQRPSESLPKKATPLTSVKTPSPSMLVARLNRSTYEKLEEMFGRNHQLAVAIEECSELIKVLTKVIRGAENDMKIAEEIADVEICLDQLKLFYDPTGANVALFKNFKIKRLENFFINGGHK